VADLKLLARIQKMRGIAIALPTLAVLYSRLTESQGLDS
jgi:hypothetical protein